MRQLIAVLGRGEGAAAMAAVRAKGATWAATLEAHDGDGERDAVLIHVPNDQVDAVVGALQDYAGARINLQPSGILELAPPASEIQEHVQSVSPRSPLEIFFGGLQSIGSWGGFLGYAVLSAVVVWLGLYTNTWFLLTAAMLIAPFAAPAMNLALGTARGDLELMGRSAARYFASLSVSVATAWLLSVVFGLTGTTDLMVRNSLVSSQALLLPLSAGVAGALNLCQSERNSLVTAAGAGVLVAASLAPQAALLGVALALWSPELLRSAAFVLLLQLAGINVAGAMVFAWFGLRPRGVRYERGRPWARWASLGVTLAGLGALLWWQAASTIELKRGSRAPAAALAVEEAINATGLAWAVEVTATFPRAQIPGQRTLLVRATVQRRGAAGLRDQALKDAVRAAVGRALEAEPVTPLVEVTVVDEGRPGAP